MRFVALVICVLAAPAVHAQVVNPNNVRFTAPAYYEFREPTEIGIRVAVHGSVEKSGLYEVPVEYPLMDLLALAGGISLGSRQRENSERITISVYRPSGSNGEPIYQVEMENDIRVLSQAPILEEGDIVFVQKVFIRGFTWRDILTLSGFALSVANFILNVRR